MNKVKFKIEEGRVLLLVEGKRVAELTRYADSMYWLLTDITLHPTMLPGDFSFVGAEDYWSEFICETESEFEFVKSNLKSYYVPKPLTIWYCTFAGIVCGDEHPPEFAKDFDQGGFFTYDRGMVQMRLIRQFWKNAESLNVKRENPKLQPSVDSLRFGYKRRAT